MNSGAPEAAAPGDRSSDGIMTSASFFNVEYSCAFKPFGLYAPVETFSCEARPWTCWAASRLNPPSVAERAMFLSRSRRVTSNISFPHFFGKIFGCSPRQRDDRKRAILIGIADEWSCVRHEQILDLDG